MEVGGVSPLGGKSGAAQSLQARLGGLEEQVSPPSAMLHIVLASAARLLSKVTLELGTAGWQQ